MTPLCLKIITNLLPRNNSRADALSPEAETSPISVCRLPLFPFPSPGCDVSAVLYAYLLSDYGSGS